MGLKKGRIVTLQFRIIWQGNLNITLGGKGLKIESIKCLNNGQNIHIKILPHSYMQVNFVTFLWEKKCFAQQVAVYVKSVNIATVRNCLIIKIIYTIKKIICQRTIKNHKYNIYI